MVAAHTEVDFAELRARNPLGDAVEAAGVVLHGKGRVRQGICPFHQETEGSFTVYANTEKFHCFGCGARGDVLDFVGRMEGLTLTQVIRRLDDGSAAVVSTSNRPAPARPTAPATLPPRDPALLTAAARFYGGQLRHSGVARDYLASRGIGLDAATRLGLGYATGSGLREYLQSAGFDGTRQRASGLFLERGAERFAGTITVPDMASGRARWLTGRAVQPDARPRFQALPGPKPVLGLASPRSGAPLRDRRRRGLRLPDAHGLGLSRRRRPGHPGDGQGGCGAAGLPPGLPGLRQRRRGQHKAAADLKQLLGNRAAVVNLPPGVADLGELATRPNGNLIFRRLLARAAHCSR